MCVFLTLAKSSVVKEASLMEEEEACESFLAQKEKQKEG